MIPVTKPFMPSLTEYQRLLKGIWKRNWLTNNGPLVNELEMTLRDYLRVSNVLYVSNGTIAIQMAIKSLGIKGEVITTPFSYVATTSSLVWEGCTPVYVDIDPDTLNIDPSKIEEAITKNTSAILATHCFGNPCDIQAIQEIADRYSLKVVYDAAHCFATQYQGKSVFEYGDISTTSFHATKLFHTVEGGGVFTKDKNLAEQLSYRRNFGHNGPEKFNGIGINGKNSELHAAMGLLNLGYMGQILDRRKSQTEYYHQILRDSHLKYIKLQDKTGFNYAYFPVIFTSEEEALITKKLLEDNQIFPRRYFYPSLSSLPYVSGNTPISDDISARILCLPIYHELTKEEQDLIGRFVLKALKKK
ncbi:DegT/DnrJ/EryC1/StrS family aminotransferase [Algoriphagus vanfongensis]|uniref:DegT/DnrJ/EryC1/StrS family aminotransferase n=1 Tax=Algoriphagus vanfongensis TaxID=426371 RepID=UPI00047B6729|nr:DegT/DnrJ/EryC1/StrS family aminotransferase [Algoriphagus vanfongensis]